MVKFLMTFDKPKTSYFACQLKRDVNMVKSDSVHITRHTWSGIKTRHMRWETTHQLGHISIKPWCPPTNVSMSSIRDGQRGLNGSHPSGLHVLGCMEWQNCRHVPMPIRWMLCYTSRVHLETFPRAQGVGLWSSPRDVVIFDAALII